MMSDYYYYYFLFWWFTLERERPSRLRSDFLNRTLGLIGLREKLHKENIWSFWYEEKESVFIITGQTYLFPFVWKHDVYFDVKMYLLFSEGRFKSKSLNVITRCISIIYQLLESIKFKMAATTMYKHKYGRSSASNWHYFGQKWQK